MALSDPKLKLPIDDGHSLARKYFIINSSNPNAPTKLGTMIAQKRFFEDTNGVKISDANFGPNLCYGGA